MMRACFWSIFIIRVRIAAARYSVIPTPFTLEVSRKMVLIKPWFTLVVIQESVVSWFKDLFLRLPLRSRRLCGAPYVTGQFTAETPRAQRKAQRVEVRPPASVFVRILDLKQSTHAVGLLRFHS